MTKINTYSKQESKTSISTPGDVHMHNNTAMYIFMGSIMGIAGIAVLWVLSGFWFHVVLVAVGGICFLCIVFLTGHWVFDELYTSWHNRNWIRMRSHFYVEGVHCIGDETTLPYRHFVQPVPNYGGSPRSEFTEEGYAMPMELNSPEQRKYAIQQAYLEDGLTVKEIVEKFRDDTTEWEVRQALGRTKNRSKKDATE